MNKKLGTKFGLASISLVFSGAFGFASVSYSTEETMALEKFELNIVEMTTGGDEILAGNFSSAIGIIQSSLSSDSKYEQNTNLCAAYILQREFATAEAYCKTALHLSRYSQSRQIISTRYISNRSRQAMALNNFGVWNALQGNTLEASEYFEAASKKGKRLSTTTERNRDALEQRITSKALPV